MFKRTPSMIAIAVSAAIVGATTVAAPREASAQSAYQAGVVQTVDWHPGKKGNWHGGKWKHGQWKYRGDRHDNDWVGPAVGFGAGVLFGSILARPHYAYPAPRYVAPAYGYYGYPSADAYCHAKYRSYNSYTKTYTGYDGKQHYCRIP